MAESHYQVGFGNHFATEALPGALPVGRNSPQRPAYGFHAEQLSGTAFSAPRAANRRSWLYRMRPAGVHGEFKPLVHPMITNRFDDAPASLNQMRWDPLSVPDEPTELVDGLITAAGDGPPEAQSGAAIYWYAANRSMRDRFFYDADRALVAASPSLLSCLCSAGYCVKRCSRQP